MRLRIPREWRIRAAIAGSLVILSLLTALWLYTRSIDRERERAEELGRIVVESETLVAPNAVGVTLWLADDAPRDVEPFGGQIYAATGSGLAVYDQNGRFVRRYTTLDGLPENSLLCLERYDDRLYIGTETAGLLAFDGTAFTRYRFVRPEAARVSALRVTGGELLVGTFEAGLFEFDGQQFTRRYQRDTGEGCRQVTALVESGSRVYVGTFDVGLFEWREGHARQVRESDGLPSDRVTGLAVRDGKVVVATDLGVAELDADGKLATVDTTPNATGIAVRGDEAWVASLTRGIWRVGGDASVGVTPTTPVADRTSLDVAGPPTPRGLPTSATGVKLVDGVLWAVTPDGLYASTSEEGPVRFERFDQSDPRAGRISAGHVAALALDGRGRLWVGLFDGGVDVLDPATGERLERIDDPSMHEINALAPERATGRMWVATSRGLGLFDGSRLTKFLGEDAGIVGANVAGVALGAGADEKGVAVATNRGVSVVEAGVARSLTAFQGLPSNHVYSVAAAGGRVYVGTLGGLAEIDHLRVSRVFTTRDSKLPHNWVNALAAADGRVFVGTYGGGVATLLPTGELAPAEETAGLDVNPGAMAVVGRRLYVGTLDRGLYTLDLDSGRWTRVSAALSSRNVTAIAADETYLYLGTEHGITRIERRALS